jgi:hypothetical protein
VLNESARFERFTVFKPPALPEVFDYAGNILSAYFYKIDEFY